MAVKNGTADDDGTSTVESDPVDQDLPESTGDGKHRASRVRERRRHSISGTHRDGRSLGMSGSSIRRSSKNKNRDKVRRLRVIIAVLLLGLLYAAGTGILSWKQKRALEADVLALDSELKTMIGELQEAREIIAVQEAELRALISGRLPNLTPLQLDTQIDLNREYLHSLTFRESGIGDDKRLEYRASLKNGGTEPVVPHVKIILFDSRGIQTGAARIGDNGKDSREAPSALEPGETRSYTSILAKLPETEYAYFLVEVH